MIPETLITYIETAIIPRYKEFDKAHNLSHVRTVIEESLALARQYPEADERLAYVIAAYHDTGLCRDRATHHLVSGEILMADSTLRQWFSDTEILLMKEAVEDHRASTDHEPRSIYGKIVAEADRIIDPEHGITLHSVSSFGGASVKRIHRPVDAEGKTVSVGSYMIPLQRQLNLRRFLRRRLWLAWWK